MTPEQEQKLNEVYEFIQSLKRSSSIPREIDQSFKERFLSSFGGITTSTKGATTENQAVNEAGSSSYSVLKAPDGFVEVKISGTTYYIPYYG